MKIKLKNLEKKLESLRRQKGQKEKEEKQRPTDTFELIETSKIGEEINTYNEKQWYMYESSESNSDTNCGLWA